MTALDVLQQLHALGVTLTPYPDGTVRCRAPKGVLSHTLRADMRQHKEALHALVEAWSERAAIAEYEAGLPRAEALAWESILEKSPAQAYAVPVLG